MKAIKHLPANVMRTLGENLLFGNAEIVYANPFVAAAIGSLKEVHQALSEALKAYEGAAAMDAIRHQIRQVDADHDRVVHIIHSALETAIVVAVHRGEDEDRLLLESCLSTVLPDGRSQAAKALHEEAGDAAVYAGNVAKVQEVRMDRILIEGLSLMGWIREWVITAEKLGKLLHKRATLANQSEAAPNLREVRTEWGNRFYAFLNALPLSGLSAETQGDLTRPFEEAVRMHRTRLAQRSKTANAVDEAPSTPEGPLAAHALTAGDAPDDTRPTNGVAI